METIEKLKEGELSQRSQDHPSATFAPPLKKEDGRIDWGKSADAIHNQVRGMNPWPGAFTCLAGKMLKIYRSKPITEDAQQEPGTVVQAHEAGIQVSTGEGCLLLTEIQLEGRKRMHAAQFLLGHPIPGGTRLGG
jgi:methionyl-tRNA formyltransferase